jgi:hypothetical protein
VHWSDLEQDSHNWRAVVNSVMNIRFQEAGNLFTR